MKKTIVVAALSCALAGTWGVALAGDAAAGKAKAAMCASCHGTDGNSMAPTFPKLAGQHEAYLVDALKQYRSGARNNAMMKPMVANLTDADIANLAAFYAGQKAK
ncbi:MAG: cytochrome c [Gammaproteobacteria bacterium]|nr:cytochrome c [Gammaproteobacteria bacterium]